MHFWNTHIKIDLPVSWGYARGRFWASAVISCRQYIYSINMVRWGSKNLFSILSNNQRNSDHLCILFSVLKPEKKKKWTILTRRLKSQLSSFWIPSERWWIWRNQSLYEEYLFSLLKGKKADRGIFMGMIYAHLFSEEGMGLWNPSPWECLHAA